MLSVYSHIKLEFSRGWLSQIPDMMRSVALLVLLAVVPSKTEVVDLSASFDKNVVRIQDYFRQQSAAGGSFTLPNPRISDKVIINLDRFLWASVLIMLINVMKFPISNCMRWMQVIHTCWNYRAKFGKKFWIFSFIIVILLNDDTASIIIKLNTIV